MNITVITSCTGKKTLTAPNQLTLADFMQGPEHVARREAQISACVAAEALYSGDQHVRLMRGVVAARRNGANVRVFIASAGYGLVPGDRLLRPYDATFLSLRAPEAKAWGQQLGLAQSIRKVLAEPADFGLILMGKEYMKACELDHIKDVPDCTWALCGADMAKRLPAAIKPAVLIQSDCSRFGSLMIGLKGAVAEQVLSAPLGQYEPALQAIINRN